MIIPCTCMIGPTNECPQHGTEIWNRERKKLWDERNREIMGKAVEVKKEEIKYPKVCFFFDNIM